MSPAVLFLGSLATNVGLWRIAELAAADRRIGLGAAPRGVLVACAALAVVASPQDAAGAIAAGALCVGGLCDARCGYIFDPLVIAGFVAVGSAAATAGQIVPMAAGAATVAGTLLVLWVVTRGRGIGLGDVKFGVVLGAGTGPAAGLSALGAAFVLGALAGGALLACRRARLGSAVRFGPYLAAGTLLVLAYHRLNTGVLR